MIPYVKIYGFPRFFERFLGEKGIFKRNRLILTGAVVGAGCLPTSISGVRPCIMKLQKKKEILKPVVQIASLS